MGFTSISYKREQWRLRQFKDLPSYVYATQKPVGPSYVYIVDPEDPLKSDIKEFDLKEFDTKHPDPALQISGKVGESLRFRVLAPWGEQAHVFSLTGHRWPLEPKMSKSEQIFARFLPPGYSFDAPITGKMGGPYGIHGDSLFLDHRLPFAKAGLWGPITTEEVSSE